MGANLVFTSNPFSGLTDVFSPLVMQTYIVLMVVAVAAGTLVDLLHKSSAKFFALQMTRTKAAAKRPLSGAQTTTIVVRTIAEAAVSGEFCRWTRRVSHVLTMYGFLLNVSVTVVLVFVYPTAMQTPAILPVLWDLGALMVLIGGSWFFFFLRANVAHDGCSPFHLGRADLFIGSLLGSAAFGLLWHFAQTTIRNPVATLAIFALYILFSTLLFVSVPWSKFAHMFYKPAVAFQKKIEEANGSSDLPTTGAIRSRGR